MRTETMEVENSLVQEPQLDILYYPKSSKETKKETEKDIPMKNDTKESLLHCYVDTLTKEEIVRVLNYMNKQKIGDSEELKEVIEAWK